MYHVTIGFNIDGIVCIFDAPEELIRKLKEIGVYDCIITDDEFDMSPQNFYFEEDE